MGVSVDDRFNTAADPALPSLTVALDPVMVEQQLNRRLHSLTGSSGSIVLRRITVTRHKPRRRCVVEYDVTIRRTGDEDEETTLVGKVRARRFGKEGYRRLKAIWDAGFHADSPDGISVPEPLGTISKFRMWLQRKVPGVVATELLAGPNGTAIAAKVAEAACKLHQISIPIESKHTIQDEVRILRERLPTILDREPRWRNRLEAVLRECEYLAATSDAAVPRIIHRDFYADQVIVDDSRLYLLDFDLCCWGDPALDVGNFLGHVTEQSLRQLGTPDALQHVEGALKSRFVELCGEESRHAVQTYTTLTLVRHIYLSTLFPDRRPFTDRIIDLCESRLHTQVSAPVAR